MSNEIKKPAANPPAVPPVPVAPPTPVPPPKKIFHGGLEPGVTVRGRGALTYSDPVEDKNAEILETIKNFDGKEMRLWLRKPENKKALDRALAARKQQ